MLLLKLQGMWYIAVSGPKGRGCTHMISIGGRVLKDMPFADGFSPLPSNASTVEFGRPLR